jgi:hypothetical protein
MNRKRKEVNMKKVLLIVFILLGFLSGATLKLIFDDTLYIHDIKSVVLYEKDEIIYTFTQDEFELWSSFMNAKDLLEVSMIQKIKEPSFKVLIALKDGQLLTEEFSLDFDQQVLEIVHSNQVMLASFNLPFVNSLLVHSSLSTYYPDAQVAFATLSHEESEIELNVVKELWAYQIVNGEYRSAPKKEKKEITTEILQVNENTPLSIKKSNTLGFIKVLATTDEGVKEIQLSEEGTFFPLVSEEVIDYQISLIYPPNELGDPIGEVVYSIPIYVDIHPKVHLSEATLTQGGVLMIQVENIKSNQTLVFEQAIVEQVIQYRIDKNVYAMIPFIYWVENGEYPLSIHVNDELTDDVIYSSIIKVVDREFSVQNLTVDNNVAASTRTDDAYTQYHAEFMPVRQTSLPKQLWEGPFIQPIEGRLTTDYGTRRRVNGALTSYRHNGIDLAAPTGTPVKASNSGKIVFSKSLILTGNTVMIDHGLGIFTYYLHMDKRHVDVGDYVKKADIIGEVGTTGFSTGPHLHFTVSYHLTNINPLSFLNWNGDWPNEGEIDE